MATGNYYKRIAEDHEEPYDWKIGPCAGMTWSEWLEIQGVDISPIDETPLETENDQGNDDQSNEDHDNDDHGDDDHGDDCKTPRATHSVRRQLKFVKSSAIQVRKTDSQSEIKKQPIIEQHIAVKKAKTSAERRAEEPEIEDGLESSDFLTPQKKQPSIEHNAPKKAKTRAERRAEEPEIEEDLESSDFITPQKKERRTDYWVNQDDLRLKRGRAFKNQQHETVAGA